jgi:hypothetical protein
MTTQDRQLTLPGRRIIQSATYGSHEEPEVTDEEALEIIEAISHGRLIFFVATQGQDRYTTRHNEVDVTRFRDPRTGEFRYAVETWLGARKWTYDFDNEAAAREQAAKDRQMVGL